MSKNRFFILFAFFIMLSNISNSQALTGSPFSMYGMGEISGLATTSNFAAGKTGIGYSDPKSINFMNPASYASIDSMTFIFDAAISTRFIKVETNQKSAQTSNTNFDNIAFAFPVARWWGVAFGILPFSKVGYNFTQSETLSNGKLAQYQYFGDQGTSQMLLGNSFRIAQKLSLGVNLSYLFGDTYNDSYVFFTDDVFANATNIRTTYNTYGIYYDLGLLYKHSIDSKNSIEFGVNYAPKQKLNYDIESIAYSGTIETTLPKTSDGKSEIPQKIGVGASYSLNNRTTFIADYLMQDWSNINVYGNKDMANLKNMSRISGGIILNPDTYSAKYYFQHITYRFGAFYENSNIYLIDESKGTKHGVKDFGITFGARLPFKLTKNSINIALLAGQKQADGTDILKESYIYLNIGFTLNENWFFKRQID